ncbi:hypothetical protein GOP47_0028713, partial [Adiantum capillus-veneris]
VPKTNTHTPTHTHQNLTQTHNPHGSKMSSHSRRCIIHPQHNQVGVCALCLRERLVALSESESSNVLSCASSTASDGAFHSFSSSSAREPHYSQVSPPPPSDHPKGQAPASASFLHKLKLKALISIPPSPEHIISQKNSAGLLYSPFAKSKPIHGQKPSTSELVANAPFSPLHVAPNDRILTRSNLPLGPHLQSKASLRSLFNQHEPTATTEHPHTGFVEKPHESPSDHERTRRIEHFCADMGSPGFTPSLSKADFVRESKQGHDSGAQFGSQPQSSWIASLFQRKKQKGTAKMKKNGIASDANAVGNGAFETSARTSVDFARLSMDSTNTALNLRQIIRSRLQQREANAVKNAAVDAKHLRGRPPLPSEHHKVQQPQPTGNINSCSYDFPARSSISIGSTINVSGTRISSTARLGVEGEKGSEDHQEAHVSEQVRRFPRSRSCGRTWNRGQSPYFSIASPQHSLWGPSKQHLNNTTHTSSIKLSSIQQHYLTSTPKHPTMDNAAPRDSRVGFGFYFSPFRRSKRQ